MKYFVIGDPDTVLGFRFAGVAGEVVESPADVEKAFAKVLRDPTVGILIITEQAAEAISEKVNAAVFERPLPVIVRIPDRQGPLPGRKTLTELIRQAIGVGV